MKRISKGLSWDRISWQVPGQALGGGAVKFGWHAACKGDGNRCTCGRCWGPEETDSSWGPGESGGGYTLLRLPEGWSSIMVRSLGLEPALLLSHWVASDEVQGHLICKMQTVTALPSF